MGKLANSVLDLIGDTPLLKLNNLVDSDSADVYVKLENYNPGNSVKDRTAYNLILQAEKRGEIKPGDTIVEMTSGNTGVGLAIAGNAKGYQVKIAVSSGGIIEHKQMLRALNADLIKIPDEFDYFLDGIEWTRLYCKEKGYHFFQQFSNPDNPMVHEISTGPEIVETLGRVPDAFVSAVGTGGTLTGTSKYLKSIDDNIKIYAMEPAEAAILSGEEPDKHYINGIGTGTIPDVLDTEIYDEVIKVPSETAVQTSIDFARKEGIFVGISAGGNVWAALQVAKKLGKGKSVVTIVPDTGETYFSTGHFENI